MEIGLRVFSWSHKIQNGCIRHTIAIKSYNNIFIFTHEYLQQIVKKCLRVILGIQLNKKNCAVIWRITISAD